MVRTETEPAKPSFREATLFWCKLGFISFGGPAGQIAIMHDELVVRRKWVSEGQFLHALQFCLLLPGPEAQQLATYLGWKLHGTAGGIVSGCLFVLPAVFVLWLFSWIYVISGQVSSVAAVFHGLKAAVLAIVAMATLRLGRRVLNQPLLWCLAVGAFIGIHFLRAPFPLIVIGVATLGALLGSWHPEWLIGRRPVQPGDARREADAGTVETNGWRRVTKVALLGLALWWLPVLGMRAWLGAEHSLAGQGLFFSKAAMVTFGGAYAVLPYVAQQAVVHHGWLSAAQMMDGLALAETTPGPLVMVLQFVGFVGAYQHPGLLAPLWAATLGAALTTWVTFVPCFLWILLGAPYVERLHGRAGLSAALAAVSAAIVGVILSLAIWFGQHAIWVEGGLDWFVMLTSLLVLTGLWRWRWALPPVVAACGAWGLLFELLR